MRLEFNSSTVDIWTKNEKDGIYALCVKIPKGSKRYKLARQINETLKYYPEGTKFKPGETPIFRFTTAQIERIATTSPVTKKILTQITKGIL